MRHAPPGFAELYEATIITGAKATDLVTAQIEDLDLRGRKLRLAEKAINGRPIETRDIKINDQLLPLLRQSVGERKSGPVFLTRLGRQWNELTLAQEFRYICRKANLPSGVVWMGRGGKVKVR